MYKGEILFFYVFVQQILIADSLKFDIGITFGRNVTVENVFAYALQSSKAVKEISGHFGNVFVDSCRLQNLPVLYEDSSKALSPFSVEEEIKYFLNEKKDLTKNDIDWSIMYIIRNKNGKKQELEDILFKKLGKYYNSNEKNLYDLLKKLFADECDDALKWMNDSKNKLNNILHTKNIADLVSLYYKSSSTNDNHFATFSPQKCVIRLNKCSTLYKPIYHPFLKTTQKLIEIQSVEGYDLIGTMTIEEDVSKFIPKTDSAVYCKNSKNENSFVPQLFLL